jgi:hypothetical protein
MSWNKQQFRDTVFNWLKSQQADTEEDTAILIGTAYHSAASNTNPVQFAAKPISLKGPALIIAGFKTSFESCKELFGNDTVNNWKPAALGITLYWTTVQFSLVPPPPGGLVGATNVVVNPGTVDTLAQDIFSAFSSDNIDDCADKLTQAMVNHLLTVKGLWSGTRPGNPPPPFAFPWTSLK